MEERACAVEGCACQSSPHGDPQVCNLQEYLSATCSKCQHPAAGVWKEAV